MQSETQTKNNLSQFSKQIQVDIKDLDLLKEALTHRSFLNETNNRDLNHNERLEFLGDAVLELLTTQYLFDKFPNRAEGDLTSFRAALVRTESLAEEAMSLDFGTYIYMSKGEEATGGRKRPYILANTFESVVGAIYLDQGLEKVEEFLHRVLFHKTDEIVKNRSDIDAKSKLQELAQEKLRVTPNYELLSETGPDHNKTFTMSIIIGGIEFGKGVGRSKQTAEQKAAAVALENWGDLYKKHKKSVKIDPLNN